MLSNHKLQTTLEEISDISKIGLALYDENGKQHDGNQLRNKRQFYQDFLFNKQKYRFRRKPRSCDGVKSRLHEHAPARHEKGGE